MPTRRFVQLIVLIGSAVLAAPATAAPSNLGAFWQLDESGGSTAVDGSGYGNTGTLSGPQRVTGRFGRGLAFDGNDDQVRVARSDSLEPGNVTVEAWVRSPASPGAYRHVVAKGASACDAASYGLYTGESGGLAFYVSDGTSWSISPNAGDGLWDGGWHHLAGTFDGSSVRVFVDGAEIGTGTPTNIALGYDLSNRDDLLLGIYGVAPCNHVFGYKGDLDEVRVWRRALGPEELVAGAAMGGATTRELDVRHYSDDSVVFTSKFAGGRNLTISTESSSGLQRIKSVRVVSVLPLLGAVNCGNGLGSTCVTSLSNGGRTAQLTVRRGLGAVLASTATLRVELVSGRTFEVKVSLAS